MKAWQLLRDVLLTGTAVFIFISQVFSRHPSDVLLAAALALTAPSVADHARALLSRPGASEPSPSGSPPPEEPSARSSGASGDK